MPEESGLLIRHTQLCIPLYPTKVGRLLLPFLSKSSYALAWRSVIVHIKTWQRVNPEIDIARPFLQPDTTYPANPPFERWQAAATSRIAFNAQYGLHPLKEPGRPPPLQVRRSRPLPDLEICSQALLQQCRYQVLPNVHGTQCHHIIRLQFRRHQLPDPTLVQPHP